MSENTVTTTRLTAYAAHLREGEHSAGTIEKYLRDVGAFGRWLGARELTKENAIAWKEHLSAAGYAPDTVNSMLSALNGFFAFIGREDCRVKFLRIQRKMFRAAAKELTQEEYTRLVRTAEAQGDARTARSYWERHHRHETARLRSPAPQIWQTYPRADGAARFRSVRIRAGVNIPRSDREFEFRHIPILQFNFLLRHTAIMIIAALCIKCGACERVCPQNNVPMLNYPYKCYVAWSKGEDDRKMSASGGVAAVFSRYQLERKERVYGCDYDENLKLKHFCLKNIEDIKRTEGSKYSQSEAYTCFYEIKGQLKKGDEVVFIGTPCQVGALINYLSRKYENLVTVDLVCHGTPPN